MESAIRGIFDVVYAPWTGILPPLVFAIYAAIRWRGRWRALAQIPLLFDVLFLAGVIKDGIKDPDGIGLGMVLVFIPLSILWIVYIAGLILVRRRCLWKPSTSAELKAGRI